MSRAVIQYRGTVEQAKSVARELVRILAGAASDNFNVAEGVYLSIGFAALSDIKADFVKKARGQTGEDGVKWPPLSRKYLAYGRRFGKGEQSKLKGAAGLGRGHRYAPGGNTGLLSKDQLKQWNAIYAKRFARLSLSMDLAAAKGRAAAFAWAILKKQGAKTKLEVFGNRTVEILRDTSVLLNSLSPGRLNGANYQKPTSTGGEQQIMETFSGGVIVGTNVPYAATHNHGDKSRGIPARTFLPDPVPQVWLDRWSEVAAEAVWAAAKIAYGVSA